jgi:lantibiotic modifying enzyme
VEVERARDHGIGGMRWALSQPLSSNEVYDGAPGLLRALCETRLSGLTEFDQYAEMLRDRLLPLRLAPRTSHVSVLDIPASPEDTSLYCGASGWAAALRCWSEVSGDIAAAAGAAATIADVAAAELSPIHDLVLGDAGAVLELVAGNELKGVGRYADSLVACAEYSDAGPDWRLDDETTYIMPNFSHGTAGVGFALARAAEALDRPDLRAVAEAAAHRLLALGLRDDGTVTVPMTLPPHARSTTHAWGWCHGPTGSVQLFAVLARHDEKWRPAMDGCLEAVRRSGIPERRYPGFWDNIAQCCGTAGVGELALDRYQATGDDEWLIWADTLAEDVILRAVDQPSGYAWRNIEHTAESPELAPEPGFMQGAAGIAAFLLRLVRVHEAGIDAQRVAWPDRV